MENLVGRIKRKLGLIPKVRIRITGKEPLGGETNPPTKSVNVTSRENTPSFFKQEGNTTMCVPFALCNAAIQQLRANKYEGLLPFTPQDLFQSIQAISGTIDETTGTLTQLGVVNVFSQAQSWLDTAGTPITIEGCKDFDVLYKALCGGKSAIIFYQDKAHELAILSYDQNTDNISVFDSLGDGLTKTYRFVLIYLRSRLNGGQSELLIE